MRWIEESKRLYVAENTLRGSLRIITFPQPNHFLHYAGGANRITNHPCYRLVEQEQLPAYVRDRTPPPPRFSFCKNRKARSKEVGSVQNFKSNIVFHMRLSPPSLTAPMVGSGSLMWFRKGIRIHDNPALEFASRGASHLYPVFVIDPHYMEPDPNAYSPGSSRAGLNRINFLLQSLLDLDLNLKKLGSRLLVLHGDPAEVLIRCLKEV